jgi:hypothetical protein
MKHSPFKVAKRKIILALVLVPMLTLLGIGAWLFLDNATGKRQWLAWKAERIAKGDRFEWQQLSPPRIPDAENFAQAPLIAGAIKGKEIDPRFKALEPPKLDKEWGDWKEGRRCDLDACAKAYGTQDLRKALAPYEATLKELEEASQRPHSQLPVDYPEHELPGLIGFRSAMRTLRLRALASLAQGQSDAALRDVQTCLRIAEHLKAEPSLLASLLRTAILGLALQPVWEGLLDHRWNEAQLSVLQQEFQGVDVLASTRLGFEGERLNSVDVFSRSAEGLPLPKGLQDPDSKAPGRLGWLGKRWFYRNLLEIDRFNATNFLDVIQPQSHRVFPEKQVDPDQWLRARRFRKDLVMAQIAIPALMGQISRAARLQSGLDQAALACALERHRLATGAYPARLEVLLPAYMTRIPLDLVTGAPLRYRREDKGYRLYSVGWDLKDEEGRLAWTTDAKPSLDPAKGDWPWFNTARP